MATVVLTALLIEVKHWSNSTFNLVERGKHFLREMMLFILISNNVIFSQEKHSLGATMLKSCHLL